MTTGPTFFPGSDPVAEGRARANALHPAVVHPPTDHTHDEDGTTRPMRPGAWRCPHGQPPTADELPEVFCPFSAWGVCPTEPPCPSLRERVCVNGEGE